MFVLQGSKGQGGKLQYQLQLVTESGNDYHYVSDCPSKPREKLLLFSNDR